MLRYLFYTFVAFAWIALLLFFVIILINGMTKNLYSTILIMIIVLLTPELMRSAGAEANLLYPLKFIDNGAVLNSGAAHEFNNEKLDFKHTYGWLAGINLIVIALLYLRNKLLHIRKVSAVIKTN